MRTGGRRIGMAIAQRQVDVGVVEVGHHVAGRDADVDVGVLALERGQARQQPQRGEGGEGGDAHVPPAARAADLAHRGVQALQQRHHAAQQLRAGAGEFDAARAAQEQRRAEFVFQALIWRLMAGCVRCSSSAAAEKLERRATASKARKGPTVRAGGLVYS